MDTDYSVFFTRRERAGSHRWEPEPGETYVEQDGQRRFYRIPRGMRRNFRAFIRRQWGDYGWFSLTGNYRDGYVVEDATD